ncbi:MAG: hypothetical protein IJY93_03965 [Clostridia bacterium]|nr:hypothetical protein [Clostridia bacterium]
MADTRGDINSIIGENLTLLSHEYSSAEERRLTQLRERALFISRTTSLLDSDNRADEFDALFDDGTVHDSIPETELHIAEQMNTQFFSDKLTVCKFLAEEYRARKINILEKLLGNEPYGDAVKIAYFRNAYADAAFRIFSDVIENPAVIYAEDFSAVCEEVYYGRADMCMLPLDSSRDAKLISFYRLIDKYELSPIFSCDVTTPDGSVTTRYALLAKSPALPKNEVLTKCDRFFFEFSLIPSDGPILCEVLSAASKCGLSLYKVDSIPLSYNESEFSCDVILKVGSVAGLEAFVLFLALAIPQYEPLGFYPHISQK